MTEFLKVGDGFPQNRIRFLLEQSQSFPKMKCIFCSKCPTYGGGGAAGHWIICICICICMYMTQCILCIVLCNGNFSLVFIGKEQNFIATLPPLEVFSTNNSVSPPFPLPHALELGLTVRDRYNSNQYIKGHVSCCKNKQKKGEVCGLKTSKNTPKHFVASFFQWKIRTVLYCPY